MFGLFILEFPSPFFVLDCKWSCCASLPFLLSFSSPLPGLAYLGFRMYIPELCCKTTWKEDLFLPLNCIDYSRRRALGSKCLSEDIPNTVCLCIYVFQVWSFPCQGEWDWHKENNECNFFSPLLLFATLLFLPLCVSLFKRESLL